MSVIKIDPWELTQCEQSQQWWKKNKTEKPKKRKGFALSLGEYPSYLCTHFALSFFLQQIYDQSLKKHLLRKVVKLI